MWYSIASYAALAALGLALARYYNPQMLNRLVPQHPAAAAVPEPKPAKKPKSKKPKLGDEKGTSAPASGNEAPSKKRKIISAPTSETVKATTTEGQQATLPRDDDGDMSNREFAQQLAKAQAGTKLEKNQAPTKKDRKAAKTALQSHKGVESPSLSAETSSTGGKDGDDDMSPNGTPPFGTPSTAQTSRAGDVSDMLEPAAAAPTTLRLTDIGPTKPKQAPKQFEQVLTKKQKQRLAKKEEDKQLRQESDRLHEAKKQQQLTTARKAAGTSKQTKANAFTSSSQNAWYKKPEIQPSQTQAQPQPQSQPLLDTFEPENAEPNGAVSAAPLENITNGASRNENANAVKQEMGKQKTEAMAGSSREGRLGLSRVRSWADEVNEDAQDEWEKTLVENESWEAVTSKKSKKKNKKDTDDSSEASTAVTRPQPAGTAANGAKKENGARKESAARPQNRNRFASMERLNGDA